MNKTNFDNKLKSLNIQITSNKTKHLEAREPKDYNKTIITKHNK